MRLSQPAYLQSYDMHALWTKTFLHLLSKTSCHRSQVQHPAVFPVSLEPAALQKTCSTFQLTARMSAIAAVVYQRCISDCSGVSVRMHRRTLYATPERPDMSLGPIVCLQYESIHLLESTSRQDLLSKRKPGCSSNNCDRTPSSKLFSLAFRSSIAFLDRLFDSVVVTSHSVGVCASTNIPSSQ